MVVVDISDLSFFVCRRGLPKETSTTRPKQIQKQQQLLIYALCDGHLLGYSQETEERKLVGFLNDGGVVMSVLVFFSLSSADRLNVLWSKVSFEYRRPR